MPEPDFIELFVEPLDRLRLTYMVTGSVASIREGGSAKHLRDVRSLLALRLPELDRGAIDRWVERFGLEREWRLVLPGTS